MKCRDYFGHEWDQYNDMTSSKQKPFPALVRYRDVRMEEEKFNITGLKMEEVGHKPRDIGSHYKQERERKQILSYSFKNEFLASDT